MRHIFMRYPLRAPEGDGAGGGAGGAGGGGGAPAGGGGSAGGGAPNAGGAGGTNAGGGASGGGSGGAGGGLDAAALARKVAELEANNARLLDETIERKKTLTKYRDKDGNLIEPEAFLQWQTEKAAEEERKRIERGEFDALRKKDQDRIAQLETEKNGIKQSWNEEKVASALVSAASSLDALPQALQNGVFGTPQVVLLFQAQFKVGDDGAVTHVSRLGKDGKPMRPAEFLEEMKAGPAANLFKASLQGGSGSGAAGDDLGDGAVRIKRSLPPIERQRTWDQAIKDGKKPKFVD